MLPFPIWYLGWVPVVIWSEIIEEFCDAQAVVSMTGDINIPASIREHQLREEAMFETDNATVWIYVTGSGSLLVAMAIPEGADISDVERFPLSSGDDMVAWASDWSLGALHPSPPYDKVFEGWSVLWTGDNPSQPTVMRRGEDLAVVVLDRMPARDMAPPPFTFDLSPPPSRPANG